MAYTKHFPEVPNTDEKCTNYVDGTTVLTAEHMGKIRDAIQADEIYLAEVDPKITELESAKDNVVLVQSTQPASEDNKIWIPTTQGQEVEVPTYDEFTDLKSAMLLEQDEIPETVQSIVFDGSGNVQSITHKKRTDQNVTVRTDVFTFAGTAITEVRTLDTGESLTIVTDTDTLVTTVTYAAA